MATNRFFILCYKALEPGIELIHLVDMVALLPLDVILDLLRLLIIKDALALMSV